MFTKQGIVSLAMLSAAMAAPAGTTTSAYQCNPAHSYPNGATCDPTGRTLVTPAPTSTSTYQCNPAHSYPNGVTCDGSALTLVTPAPTSTSAYQCNPAHSYPNGATCDPTGRTLVTPAPTSTSAYQCNPAHSYPNGVTCDGSALTLVTPAPSSSSFLICNAAAIARGACSATAASVPTSSAYQCNPAHSYPNGATCDPTGRTLITPAATQSAAATSVVAAASTAAAAPGETMAQGLTWTAANLTRYCAEDNSGCDYNFVLTASDKRPDTKCTVSRYNVGNAKTESWSNQKCDSYAVSWGYSAQFGENNAFAVMTVVNDQEKAKAYFGVANVNSQPVTASSPSGSGNFGNIGPQPVYLF